MRAKRQLPARPVSEQKKSLPCKAVFLQKRSGAGGFCRHGCQIVKKYAATCSSPYGYGQDFEAH